LKISYLPRNPLPPATTIRLNAISLTDNWF
jgi:hypothetical protein